MADREDMIRKVQALWARADHPNTPEAEKEACITKARDLMAKYTIDEMVLAEAKGIEDAVVLSDIRITSDTDTQYEMVNDQRIMLAHFIATNNRCKTVIIHKSSTVDATTGNPIVGGQFMQVVGYKSDVDMVRDLYFSLGMDMLMALFDEKTDHMKGRAYNNFAANFCDGFACRIDDRLKAIKKQVEVLAESTGNLLPVLRSRELAVQDTFTKMYPSLTTVRMAKMQYDPNAQARGRAAADKADLGQSKVGGGSRGELR